MLFVSSIHGSYGPSNEKARAFNALKPMTKLVTARKSPILD